MPVDDEFADAILSVNDVGRKLYNDLFDSRIKSTTVTIHDPIKRQILLYSKMLVRKYLSRQKVRNRL